MAWQLSDLAALNAELAALVRAGLPLEPQLRRLARELPGRSAELAERIGQRLEAGDNLVSALDAEGDTLPSVYRAAVAAGLRSGQLGAALESLVESAARLEHIRRAIGVALVYPFIVVAIVWAALAMVLFVALPIFRDPVPRFDLFQGYSPIVAGVVAVAIIVPTICLPLSIVGWWRSRRANRAFRAPLWKRLSPISRVRYFGQVATFTEILRLLIEANAPLDEALTIAGQATSDHSLQRAATGLAADVGAGLFAAGSPSASAIPPLVRLALRSANQRPLLLRGLGQAAEIYRDRAGRAATWTSEYLPIVLTASLAGAATLGLAVAVFWPYVAMLYELAQWN
jgi:type II secretory pathway component PulF